MGEAPTEARALRGWRVVPCPHDDGKVDEQQQPREAVQGVGPQDEAGDLRLTQQPPTATTSGTSEKYEPNKEGRKCTSAITPEMTMKAQNIGYSAGTGQAGGPQGFGRTQLLARQLVAVLLRGDDLVYRCIHAAVAVHKLRRRHAMSRAHPAPRTVKYQKCSKLSSIVTTLFCNV